VHALRTRTTVPGIAELPPLLAFITSHHEGGRGWDWWKGELVTRGRPSIHLSGPTE
jgi:hypothetical protein